MNKKKIIQTFNLLLIILIFFLVGIIVGFYINDKKMLIQDKVENTISTDTIKNVQLSNKYNIAYASTPDIIDTQKVLKLISNFKHENKDITLENINNNTYYDVQKNTTDNMTEKVTEIDNTTYTNLDLRPKLAIIIDDVSFLSQLEAIQQINLPITMSFLPPTSIHKNSAKIAQNIEHHIIHLPLEALRRKGEEENTLYTTDDFETIDLRISSLRKLYPRAKYINNHTGSKFTTDYEAMEKLFFVLKKYNFIFIDSKTNSNTHTQSLAKKFDLPFLERNIFLDNIQETEYIERQLKKVVKIAKEKGSAIAIGHPHQVTLDTIKASKKIFKDIDIVYINKISLK